MTDIDFYFVSYDVFEYKLTIFPIFVSIAYRCCSNVGWAGQSLSFWNESNYYLYHPSDELYFGYRTALTENTLFVSSRIFGNNDSAYEILDVVSIYNKESSLSSWNSTRTQILHPEYKSLLNDGWLFDGFGRSIVTTSVAENILVIGDPGNGIPSFNNIKVFVSSQLIISIIVSSPSNIVLLPLVINSFFPQ